MEVSEVIQTKQEKRDIKTYKYVLSSKIRSSLYKILRAVIIAGICFVILYPLFMKFSISLRDETDLYDASVRYIPKNITLENYKLAWEGMDYPNTFLRTFVLSAVTSILQLVSCMLTAYGFAKFDFPGKNLLFAGVILMLIVPPQIIMLPLFMNYRFFDVLGIAQIVTGGPANLIDTPLPFFISAITTNGFKNGLYIFIFRQFFRNIPKELQEAAYVDGCGRFRTFVQIILPSTKAMSVTIFLFGFVWQWTDSFYSGMYLPTYQVMSNALSGLAQEVHGRYQTVSGLMNFVSPGFEAQMNITGVVLIVVPLLILYVFCQRFFVESIEHSGIVG